MDRLGAAGSAFCAVLSRGGTSGAADPAGGGAAFAQTHRGVVGRSGVRALGAGSVHAIFLRGRIFSTRLSAGALVAGNAGCGVSRRRAESAGDRSGGGGYDGAGKSDCASDRARTAAHRDRTVGPARETSRAAIAAILCARGAKSGDEDGPLPARTTEETRQAPGEISACAFAAADPRRASQDGGASRAGGIVRRAARGHARTRLAHRTATARRSRLRLLLARAGNRVHQQRQSA